MNALNALSFSPSLIGASALCHREEAIHRRAAKASSYNAFRAHHATTVSPIQPHRDAGHPVLGRLNGDAHGEAPGSQIHT